MILTLHTETVIDSCHYLKGYDGKCSNMHGHSWLLEVWIQGDSSQKDFVGILFDFGKINEIKEKFDHKILNDVIGDFKLQVTINPTAENLSEIIYTMLKLENPNLQFKVRLYETAVKKETWCECGDF